MGFENAFEKAKGAISDARLKEKPRREKEKEERKKKRTEKYLKELDDNRQKELDLKTEVELAESSGGRITPAHEEAIDEAYAESAERAQDLMEVEEVEGAVREKAKFEDKIDTGLKGFMEVDTVRVEVLEKMEGLAASDAMMPSLKEKLSLSNKEAADKSLELAGMLLDDKTTVDNYKELSDDQRRDIIARITGDMLPNVEEVEEARTKCNHMAAEARKGHDPDPDELSKLRSDFSGFEQRLNYCVRLENKFSILLPIDKVKGVIGILRDLMQDSFLKEY